MISPAQPPPLSLRIGVPLLLLGLALAVFGPLSRAEFVHWDDFQTVADNPALNPATFASVMQYWSPWHAKMDLYAPVTYSMWGVLAAISPRQKPTSEGITLAPALFHLANVLLHTLSAIFVWQILRRLVRNNFAAMAGAVLFLVHPVQVEAIGWISGGKDVLSGMLCLLALWMYLDFAQIGNGKSRRYVAYAIATIAFVAATLAKPQAVALPLVVGVIDVLWLKRDLRISITNLLLWFAWCIPIVGIGKTVQTANLLDSPLWFRPIIALDTVAFYLQKILWPANLMPDYGRSPHWLIFSVDRFWTWLVPVMVLIICIAVRRRTMRPITFFILFLAALSPILGIVQFDFQSYSTVGDHYLYLAMLAPVLAVASILANFDWKKWIAPAILIVAACAIASNRQCLTWRDTDTLFQHNFDLNPSSLAAQTALGVYWCEHGDPKLGLGLLAQCIQDHPTIGLSHFTYANMLMKENLINQALGEYEEAIKWSPNKPIYYTSLGLALGNSGRPDLAFIKFQYAAGLDPGNPANYELAAVSLIQMGRIDQARWFLNRALQLDPSRNDIRQHLQSLPTTRGGAG